MVFGFALLKTVTYYNLNFLCGISRKYDNNQTKILEGDCLEAQCLRRRWPRRRRWRRRRRRRRMILLELWTKLLTNVVTTPVKNDEKKGGK